MIDQPTRRELIGATFLTVLGRAVSSEQTTAPAAREPAALGPTDGALVYVGRDPVRIKVGDPQTRGRFGMITQDVSPGTSIPVHLHEREDEIIFIQSGNGEATLGDARIPLAAGSVLFVPQGTWHGGKNTSSDVLRWIAIYSPSGFEGYFREIGRDSPDAPPRLVSAEERRARDQKFGIRYR